MMAGTPTGKILVVTNDRGLLTELQPLLRCAEYAVETFGSLSLFFEHVSVEQPCCLLADLALVGPNPASIIRDVSSRGLVLPIIFVLKEPDTLATVRTMKAGAFSVLSAPFEHQPGKAEIAAALRASSDALRRWSHLDSLRCR